MESGYTHCWEFESIPNKDHIKTACDEFKKFIKLLNCNIFLDRFDDRGIYPPEISSDRIWFNKADFYTDCQQFKIDFNKIISGDSQTKVSFCKTNGADRYDKAVCLVLICLANNIKGFKISSNAKLNHWRPYLKAYETNIKPFDLAARQLILIDGELDILQFTMRG